MVLGTLLTLCVVCVVVVAIWFLSTRAKSLIVDLGPLLTMLSSLVALTVFLQFYSDYKVRSLDEQRSKQEEKARLNSRMVALGSEIINDIQTCNLLSEETQTQGVGVEIPTITIDCSVMNDMIIRGDITYHRLRSELISLRTQIQALNRIVEMALEMSGHSYASSPHEAVPIHMRIGELMQLYKAKLPPLRKQLTDVEPLFQEQWNHPEKYITEEYLKNRMMPEALVR